MTVTPLGVEPWPGEVLPAGARVVVSRLSGPDGAVPPWAVVGLGRQDELLTHADVVICGGGHGMVAKTLLAGVPMGASLGWRVAMVAGPRRRHAESFPNAAENVLSFAHFRDLQ